MKSGFLIKLKCLLPYTGLTSWQMGLQEAWSCIHRKEKDAPCLFPSDLSAEVGKVSILGLLERLQAVRRSWVSVNGFLCSWLPKLPVSISFCLCCSGTSLPTVALFLEGEVCPPCDRVPAKFTDLKAESQNLRRSRTYLSVTFPQE